MDIGILNIPSGLKNKLSNVLEGGSFLKIRKEIPFAYPCANYMETILSIPRVKSTLESIVNEYYGHQIENIKKVIQKKKLNQF